MFGVLETRGCRLTEEGRAQWWSHICGTCLALRDAGGQLARLTTNYDAALISVLCEAQSAAPLSTISQVCPLRGFRRARVIAPGGKAARFAAAVSTLMASTKIDDHLADGDHWIRHLPSVFRSVSGRWRRTARDLARGLGFDTSAIERRVEEQTELERHQGRSFSFYSRPTEESTGEVCAHTATLMDRPANSAPLRGVGRMFGRAMFLLDSYRDLDQDRRNGQFNALAAAYSDVEARDAASGLFADAHRRLRACLEKVELPRPGLATRLLVTELGTIGRQVLHLSPAERGSEGEPDLGNRKRKRLGDGCYCCCDACNVCCDCCSSCTECKCGSSGCDCCGDCCCCD